MRQITQQLATLDPDRDYEKIVYLLQSFEFPWDCGRALEFALFRTYAVPTISALLANTGEFLTRPRKRYDDTELILCEIIEHGFESDRGRAALARMNQMHGRFRIANADFVYVLSTFVFEPIRWIERFGWRSLGDNEKQGIFRFYCELGRRMNIKGIPAAIEDFEAYNLEYERKNFCYSEANVRVGSATRDLLLGFYLPPGLWPLGNLVVYALLDDPLREAFGFPKAPLALQAAASTTVRLRSRLASYVPERRKPYLATQIQRPTYPEGHRIEELGTFHSFEKRD